MAAGKTKGKNAKKKTKGLSETQRWILGIVFLAFAVYLLVAVTAYYFQWADDQNFVRWGDIWENNPELVSNPTGKSGAVMANYIVGEWFGVFGLMIPVILIILALRVINYRPTYLSRSVRVSLLIMILGSLSLGYIFGTKWGVFGTGLGGAHGIVISDWIRSFLGTFGTALALILGWILLGVYINGTRTISAVNRVGKGIYEGGKMVRDHASDLVTSHADQILGDEDYGVGERDARSYAAREDIIAQDGEGPEEAPVGRKSSIFRRAVESAKNKVTGNTEDETIPDEEIVSAQGQEEYEPDDQEHLKDEIEIIKPAGDEDYRGLTEVDGRGVRNAGDERNGRAISVEDPNVVELGSDPGRFVGGAGDVPFPGVESGQKVFTVGGAAIEREVLTVTDARGNGTSDTGVLTVTGAGTTAEADPKVFTLGEEVIHNTGGYKPDGRVGGVTEQGVYTLGEESAVTSADPNVFTVGGDNGPQERYDFRPGDNRQESGTFEVVDNGGTPLSLGGVVETVASGGATADGKLEVVVAGHTDAIVSDDQIDASLYDPTLELSSYQKPPVEILEDHSIDVQVTEEEIYENKNQIVRTLENFGIRIDKIKATIGPTVTLYEIVPAPGVKISKIKNLEDDIALSLKALGIRIIAPMPGKGTVGIEVPNKDKEIVSMYSVVKTMKFQESNYELPIVLGKTISNETFMIDLAKMPHLLVAGSTGQGKSVGLNAIITSLLYRKHPAELKFVLVDPKRVELSLYSKLERHFLAKMESEDEAIITDTQKVVYTLNSLCNEMSERYELLRMAEVKKLSEYNEKFLKRRLNPKKGHRFMPYIVVVIDEFADMIMTAGREVETPITRLAQLARAVGIHLVIATQRPDVKVITGLIKANFPARIAFRVMSMVDSRTIIDQPGANQLIGRGDMLMSLNGELTRVQCAFIDTPEIERITEFIGNQRGYQTAYLLPDYQPDSEQPSAKSTDMGRIDDMFEEVARFVVQNQQGSTSSIQRRFSIGYNRAGRIMDQLEMAGIVGRAEGSKPREVLITDVASLEYVIDRVLQE